MNPFCGGFGRRQVSQYNPSHYIAALCLQHSCLAKDGLSISVVLRRWVAFFERNGESIIRVGSHGALDIADTLGLRWPYWQTGTWRITNQLYTVSAVDRVDAWISLIFPQCLILNRVDGGIVHPVRPTRAGYAHLHPAVDSVYAADIEGFVAPRDIQGKLANICTFFAMMEVGSCDRTLRQDEKSDVASKTSPIWVELVCCTSLQGERPLSRRIRNM
jgi:hypothetical protein